MLTDPAPVLAALGLPASTGSALMPGFEASVWRVDLADGRTVAVRALRPGRWAARELEALRLAASRTASAPRVIASGRVGDQDTLVTTWCAGTPIGDLLATGHDDPTELGTIFGRAHAGLHRDVDGTTLCHNDFQPFNVLAQHGTVTGIVDWSMGAIGDPRADLAWTTVVLALGPAVFPHLAAVTAAFVVGWRAGYALEAGLPDDAELRPFVAAAAQRQASEWRERAALGECLPAVANAAAEISSRWDT